MNTTVTALEEQVRNAKDLVERRDMAIKLASNREFRKLVLDDFCTTEAARLVQMSCDPAMDPQQRADALAMAQATGHFKRYMSMMVQMGAVAEREIQDLEEELVSARQEADMQEQGIDIEDD
jgi:hypothetical protein